MNSPGQSAPSSLPKSAFTLICPVEGSTWLSITVVGWAGVLYYGVAVHTRGFGSYRQLLPLLIFQNVLAQSIAGVVM